MALDTTIGGVASDSYVTQAEFLAYASAMGRTITTETAASAFEPTLRRAARVIDDQSAFRGQQTYQHQALSWPRAYVGYVDGWDVRSDTIPADIKRAQMEMALAMLEGVDPFPVTLGVIGEESSSIGPLSKSVTYLGGKGRPAIPAVDRILLPYLTAGSSVSVVMRA